MTKGKLIVLEGIDGSGKATQTLLLAQKLEKDGYKVHFINFPQYGQKSAGMIENYLKDGRYGSSEEVGAYKASLFYAMDRFDASFQIKKWLNEGSIVLSDRYVGSNMAHQGCKIDDPEERQKFFDWIYDLEYEIMELPKPTINIVLKIDPEKGQILAKNDNKKKDLHEDDIQHLQKAAKIYDELLGKYEDFQSIECMENGKILSLGVINDKLYQKVSEIIKDQNDEF